MHHNTAQHNTITIKHNRTQHTTQHKNMIAQPSTHKRLIIHACTNATHAHNTPHTNTHTHMNKTKTQHLKNKHTVHTGGVQDVSRLRWSGGEVRPHSEAGWSVRRRDLTSAATLRSRMFDAMFSAVEDEDNGSVFLDRDGTCSATCWRTFDVSLQLLDRFFVVHDSWWLS
jgi:hypothetical protein